MIPKTNLKVAIDYARRQIIHTSIEREIKSWHSVKGRYNMLECFGVSFKAPIPIKISELQTLVKPNLPWAEDHFFERVSGKPLNPGKEYKNWPFYKMDEAVRRVPTSTTESKEQIFSHTYMERYWPKQAMPNPNDPIIYGGPKRGIRYYYGDLNDVITLLQKDPHTRQAYLPVWFPEDTGAVHGERVPCSLGYLFELIKDHLHVTYYIRSCDYLRHFRDDIYLTCRLTQFILSRLLSTGPDWKNVSLGFITMHIANLHIFTHELKKSLNMKRPTRTELYLAIAVLMSHRATCKRGRVGAIITKNNRIVSTGYNGVLPGETNCEEICFIDRPCERAVHAEANAIAAAAKAGISLEDSTLYCTTAPCIKCAELIIQSGITTVIYLGDYRSSGGIDLLKRRKVETTKNEITYNFNEPIQDNNFI